MSSLEVIMHVNVVSFWMACLAEAVHVELSNEGAKVAVLEVTGQDLFGKAPHLTDVEAVSATRPAYHIRDLQVLLKESSTYTISSSLLMKSGTAEQRPFRLRLRFILSIYYIHPPDNMHTMLRRALERLLQKHLNMPPQQELLAKNIVSVYQHDITYSKLARLPLSELKNAVKIPCPISEDGSSENQIAVYKRLRYYMTVEEAAVCVKCTRVCPFRTLPFKEMPVKPDTTNKEALNDLLTFLINMS